MCSEVDRTRGQSQENWAGTARRGVAKRRPRPNRYRAIDEQALRDELNKESKEWALNTKRGGNEIHRFVSWGAKE